MRTGGPEPLGTAVQNRRKSIWTSLRTEEERIRKGKEREKPVNGGKVGSWGQGSKRQSLKIRKSDFKSQLGDVQCDPSLSGRESLHVPGPWTFVCVDLSREGRQNNGSRGRGVKEQEGPGSAP